MLDVVLVLAMRVYANCIDGDDDIANRRISGVLA